MLSAEWEWTRTAPSKEGWYPVLLCWDSDEGFFPSELESDGSNWTDCVPVAAIGKAGPFTEARDAEKWAQDHDPGM
jgi:hypothetical protein